MEDSNANWGDPTVVLILKTAQDRELSSGTSRQISNPKHRDLAWNSFGTFNRDPSRKVWEVSPHWSAVNRILVALAPSLRCLLNISASPGRSYFQTLSRTSSTNAKSLTTGEVLDRMIVSSMVESSHRLCVSTRSPMISSPGQKWPLVVPNVRTNRRLALPDVFRSARLFNGRRHILPMNPVTYTIQGCNKNHVYHISSGPCLKLKTFGSRGKKASWARWQIDDSTCFPPPLNGIMYIN